jgi:hypothetical protein
MRTFATLLALALLLAAPAQARDTEHFFSAAEAAESDVGKAKLLDVPFYLRGQEHPAFGRELLEMSTEKSTRGAFRTDLTSCRVAFLSALIALQQRAQAESAAAIVDIVSITRGKETESATDYRCIAGTTIVHVGLRGKLVAAAD